LKRDPCQGSLGFHGSWDIAIVVEMYGSKRDGLVWVDYGWVDHDLFLFERTIVRGEQDVLRRLEGIFNF
jgi:hypothetical protein